MDYKSAVGRAVLCAPRPPVSTAVCGAQRTARPTGSWPPCAPTTLASTVPVLLLPPCFCPSMKRQVGPDRRAGRTGSVTRLVRRAQRSRPTGSWPPCAPTTLASTVPVLLLPPCFCPSMKRQVGPDRRAGRTGSVTRLVRRAQRSRLAQARMTVTARPPGVTAGSAVVRRSIGGWPLRWSNNTSQPVLRLNRAR